MQLTKSQKEELKKLKEEKIILIASLKKSLSEAIEVAKEEEESMLPPPSEQEEDDVDPQVGQTIDSGFDINDALKGLGEKTHRHHHHSHKDQASGSSDPVPPPKPPRIHTHSETPAVVIDQGHETHREGGVSSLTVMPLKLGPVELPTFNGNLTEWTAFKDLFEYLIHNNRQLTDILKFHQLRSKLRGPALETIKGYQITGRNYALAWNE